MLIVGSLLPDALETYYYSYLMKRDISVSFFDSSSYYNVQSIKEKFYFRYFPGLLFNRVNDALLQRIQQDPPDIVWIFKGIEFFPQTLKSIAEKGIKLINYNPDHPFIRTFVSNGGSNVEECVPFYDAHFCYSRDLMKKVQSEYKLKSYWLPFGYNLADEEYRLLQGEKEEKRVCFIGNPDRLRALTARKIAEKGYEIDVYGYNWKQYLSPNHKIRIFDQVIGMDYWKTLRRYRIQLNIFRPHNVNSHNMRTFEIPACGGIQVAPFSDENVLFFEDGKEIFLFRNDDELIAIVDSLLRLSDIEATQIRKASRYKVLQDHCSYEDRAHYVHDLLQNL